MAGFHAIEIKSRNHIQNIKTGIWDIMNEVICQTWERAFYRDIETRRRELKIRRAAEYFWPNLRCLDSRWNTVLSFWYIFAIETKVTCDQASLIFFVAVQRYAWYNYLNICLLLVQNLDFSLIGQETKRYLELSHDWLPLWRYDFR